MWKRPCATAFALLALLVNTSTQAELYNFQATVTMCTGTCDSFASLAVGTTLTGQFDINTTPSGSFGDGDVGAFSLQWFNPALPVSGPVGDPVNDNPSVVDSGLGTAASNGTSGTTDAGNLPNGGLLLLQYLVPPLSSNGAFIVFDLATGNGRLCLFYATAGCIPGATEAVAFEGSFSLPDADTDGDGVFDSVDNCTNVANPSQLDTDGDGHGNICDADLSNDCIINPIDLGLFKSVFFTADPDGDFSGDGVVNAIDLGILRSLFFLAPGPSAPGAICN